MDKKENMTNVEEIRKEYEGIKGSHNIVKKVGSLTCKDLKGQVFGRLKVIEPVGRNKRGAVLWLCACSCGNQTILPSNHLTRPVEPVRSCGCLGVEARLKATTKHGLRKTRIWNTYTNMVQRCCNPNNTAFHNYGGRGVKVCEEWRSDFMNFYNWAMKNGYTDELTIDRINIEGNYEPNNCRWVDMEVQGNNKRNNHFITYKGETKTVTQWSRLMTVSEPSFRRWLKRNGDENAHIYLEKKLIKGSLKD